MDEFGNPDAGKTILNRVFSSIAKQAPALSFALAIAIAVGTLTPSDLPVTLGGSDKTHHLVAFAGLVFPFSLAGNSALVRIVVLASLYGAAIELVQPSIGRSGEWADLVADLVGIVIGAGLGFLSRRFL